MLKTGKLDSALLEQMVFQNITFKHPEVLTRAGIGEDCAVVDFGDYECVLSTDPITAAISEIGRLAIHISCNDIASNGVQPLGIMLAVMLPVGTTEEEVREMMRQAGETAGEMGIEIIGGHTEITPAVTQPVIVSTAIGKGSSKSSQSAADMRPGDLIFVTKAAGLEGTGIIACDYAERLSAVLSAEELREAKEMLRQVSVVKEGVLAGRIGTCGMHDVTEGGILGAVWEMCRVSDTGAEVYPEEVPVSPITRKVCREFDIDPLRLISSGCMMIVLRPEKRAELEKALGDSGIPFACIGKIREKQFGVMMKLAGEWFEVAPPSSDELYKVVGR